MAIDLITLPENLTQEQVRIQASSLYNATFSGAKDSSPFTDQGGRSKSPVTAKTLLEFYDLVRRAILNYEIRAGTPEEHRVLFTEEEPDKDVGNPAIVYSLVSRAAGQFSQGAPLKGNIKNFRPVFREEMDDPHNPGYKIITFGYFYDNVIRFTCWAVTNKAANEKAQWFENLMEEYSWWFKLQGIDRVLYLEQRSDIVLKIDSNKWYGRPIDFFVRTEKVRVFSEKSIEQILLRYSISEE